MIYHKEGEKEYDWLWIPAYLGSIVYLGITYGWGLPICIILLIMFYQSSLRWGNNRG